jgi:hypothetical protein
MALDTAWPQFIALVRADAKGDNERAAYARGLIRELTAYMGAAYKTPDIDKLGALISEPTVEKALADCRVAHEQADAGLVAAVDAVKLSIAGEVAVKA